MNINIRYIILSNCKSILKIKIFYAINISLPRMHLLRLFAAGKPRNLAEKNRQIGRYEILNKPGKLKMQATHQLPTLSVPYALNGPER